MSNVSRKVLLVPAVFAIALLAFSLAAGFFPGWVVASVLGIYVVVALTYPAMAQLRGARGPAGPRGPAGAHGGFDPNKVSYVVSAPQSVGPGKLALVNANCPAGTKAIGGCGGVSGGQMVSSATTPNGTGWAIGVANPYSETINQVYAFAVCAAP